MAFDPDQFRIFIDRVLMRMGYSSPPAIHLLLGTSAAESYFGAVTRQKGGPALGAFGMEPATERDIWVNYLARKPHLAQAVFDIGSVAAPDPFSLEHNLPYQIAIARCHYLRRPEPLPDADDLRGLAGYWKRYWNTVKGKGSVQKFMNDYRFYVEGGGR